ncbi:hypothetical protein [Streptomyces sp. NPDC004976]
MTAALPVLPVLLPVLGAGLSLLRLPHAVVRALSTAGCPQLRGHDCP